MVKLTRRTFTALLPAAGLVPPAAAAPRFGVDLGQQDHTVIIEFVHDGAGWRMTNLSPDYEVQPDGLIRHKERGWLIYPPRVDVPVTPTEPAEVTLLVER